MISSPTIAAAVAGQLLQVSAVRLNPERPFRWSSGWLSPIYCDNRLTLSYPSVRSFLQQELAALVGSRFPTAEVVAGVATAGVPQATLVADRLQLPLLYVRGASKGHGLQNRIEGKVEAGRKVVVVEDLISTGKSSIQAAEALREADLEVVGLVAIFTYGLPQAAENFRAAGLPYYCLSSYEALLEVAVADGHLDPPTLASLSEWRRDPARWTARHEAAAS